MSTDLSILVISYNTRDLTLACLASVYRHTPRRPFEVIVVDNASRDGSAEAIGEQFPQARLIASADNLGFARANNLSARHATGRYLLLLNPDTEVFEGTLDNLLAFAEARPEAGIWGGRTYFADGSLNPTSCWGRPTPWSMTCRGLGMAAIFRGHRWLDPESLGPWPRDTAREVDIVTGCFLMITRELWDRLEGFDSAFFMYGEDADLCLRARQLGARPVICPDARLIHHQGQSETVRADKIIRLLTARGQLIARHWSAGSRWYGRLMQGMWVVRRYLAWSLLDLLGRATASDKRATYRTVWQRRDEWMATPEMPPAASPASSST